MRLQNGTQTTNTLGIGAPDSDGVTQLPNGTYAAFINGGGPGRTIGPVLVGDYHNGTVAATAPFYVTKPSGKRYGHKRYNNARQPN